MYKIIGPLCGRVRGHALCDCLYNLYNLYNNKRSAMETNRLNEPLLSKVSLYMHNNNMYMHNMYMCGDRPTVTA